jgi:hypothetical protein
MSIWQWCLMKKPEQMSIDGTVGSPRSFQKGRNRPSKHGIYDPVAYQNWYARNAGKKRAYAKERYAKNPELHIANAKKYREDNPGCWVDSHRIRLYGITSGQYITLLVSQFNECAICAIPFDKKNKATSPHIDHDHATGKVHGILCSVCNLGLGRIEKPGFLKPALEYLERAAT